MLSLIVALVGGFMLLGLFIAKWLLIGFLFLTFFIFSEFGAGWGVAWLVFCALAMGLANKEKE